MKVELNGQVSMVTGAGRGIGRAIADTLAANGARVIYSDVDLAFATAGASASPNARPLAMDVTDEKQVAAGIAGTIREFGQLDILVNNAGINTLQHRVTIERKMERKGGHDSIRLPA